MPLFYQQVSLQIFSQLVVKATPEPVALCAQGEVSALTYEEENAVRYMGGYVIRALIKDNKTCSGIMNDSMTIQNQQSLKSGCVYLTVVD